MTMTIRTPLRTLAAASLLALALTSVPAGMVHAAPISPKPSAKQDCVNRGFEWTDGKGCADKRCLNGAGKSYEPGEVRSFKQADGSYRYIFCDGYTGRLTDRAIFQTGSPNPQQPPTASR